jgi:hypothetical protein
MSVPKAFTEPMIAPQPITTAVQAQELTAHFVEVMETLIEVVQRETELVRAGRLSAAAELQKAKSELTRLYIADTLLLRASHANLVRIAPQTLTHIRERHDSFRALLQINLTVLATAHAVSEGIVRGVSEEIARKARPQIYGASGRANLPSCNTAAPIAVSRML